MRGGGQETARLNEQDFAIFDSHMLYLFDALSTVAAKILQDFHEQEPPFGSHMLDVFEALRAVAAESLQDFNEQELPFSVRT